MPKTKLEIQLLKEFRKLSPEAKGEVFQYAKWMRDVEAKERLREFRKTNYRGRSEGLSTESTEKGSGSELADYKSRINN